MIRLRHALGILTLLAPVCVARSAEDGDIHVPGGQEVGWAWQVSDGAGTRWDVQANGMVTGGSAAVYDMGMVLRVNDQEFQWGQSGRLSQDRQEVEIGPWPCGQLKVWRRIYVDPKVGYCRWIDIFENAGQTPFTAAVRYHSSMSSGTQTLSTSSGKNEWTAQDWGFITSPATASGPPCVIHVLSARNAKVKPQPRFSSGNRTLFYQIPLTVPGGKTVALCIFHAQRRPLAEAQKFLKSFRPEQELQKVPSALRKLMLNMGSATLTMGSLELPRHESQDLLVLRNGNELLGSILNTQFAVEAFYGRLDLPAPRVVGLSVPATDEDSVRVALVDGQVVVGKLLSGPIQIKLVNGNEMSLPPDKISTASFSLSASRPAEIEPTGPIVVLRSGERLLFRPGVELNFHTEYGDLKLSPDDLSAILFDTPEGGLHRAVFRNASVLSGLLTAQELKLALVLGPALTIRQYMAERFAFPGPPGKEGGTNQMRLRNDDELYGSIADKDLTVETRFGKVVAALGEIAEVTFPEGFVGRVQIKMHNGTTITGRLVQLVINFQIERGPRIPVFVGHITGITSATGMGKEGGDAPAKRSGGGAGVGPGGAPPPPPGPPAVPVIPEEMSPIRVDPPVRRMRVPRQAITVPAAAVEAGTTLPASRPGAASRP